MMRRVARVFWDQCHTPFAVGVVYSPPSLQSNHRVSEIPLPLNIISAHLWPTDAHLPQSEVPMTTRNEDKQLERHGCECNIVGLIGNVVL